MINITREQFFEFIKKENEDLNLDYTVLASTKHYLKYFDKYQSTGKKTNWNWWGFCAPCIWLAYRRIYDYLFLVLFSLFITLIIGFIGMRFMGEYFLLVPIIAFTPLVCMISAVYGDYIYVRYASSKISEGVKTRGVSILGAVMATIFLGGANIIMGIFKLYALITVYYGGLNPPAPSSQISLQSEALIEEIANDLSAQS